MTDMNASPPIESSSLLDLPELQQAALARGVAEQLFRDLEQCAELLEVISKSSRRGYVNPDAISLSDGKRMLLNGELRALQIRYRYQGSEWWDTLMNTPDGLRLVRIGHPLE